jgi:hypothetical protein
MIWAAPDQLSVVLILAVVLPKADWANLEDSASAQRLEFAAWTSVGRNWLFFLEDVDEFGRQSGGHRHSVAED